MLAKLMEAISNQNSNDQDPFSGLDFEAFKAKSAATLRQALRSMDAQAKRELLQWIQAVRQIRNNPGIGFQEKVIHLSNLPTSETAMIVVKAMLDAAIQNAPAQNQNIIRTGLSGIGMATNLMKMRINPIAFIVLSKAIPGMLISPQFEPFAQLLEKELLQIMKELNSPSTDK